MGNDDVALLGVVDTGHKGLINFPLAILYP